jgi:secreted trypsin-like serine protease
MLMLMLNKTTNDVTHCLLFYGNVFMCYVEFAGKIHVPLDEHANRITGGYTAARGQFPWQVAIITDNWYFCGGSLISSQWVLTAARCG